MAPPRSGRGLAVQRAHRAQAAPYRAYEAFPRLVDGLSALEDQRLGGAVMEAAEGAVIFGLMLAIVVRMVRAELRVHDRAVAHEGSPTSAGAG